MPFDQFSKTKTHLFSFSFVFLKCAYVIFWRNNVDIDTETIFFNLKPPALYLSIYFLKIYIYIDGFLFGKLSFLSSNFRLKLKN